ncbi:MAG: hypothetical protein NTU53_07870, partial [Planctomycetota bacterium]|nr:hypothetical protein [Planctomycetota bacterium]
GALILSKTGGTTAAQVFDMLASGRNGGDWNGTGLVSSTAAARFLTDGFTGLTQAEDAGGNVVVKYSWNGDVNQDALVNADDYFYVDSGYITKDPGYANGDLMRRLRFSRSCSRRSRCSKPVHISHVTLSSFRSVVCSRTAPPGAVLLFCVSA